MSDITTTQYEQMQYLECQGPVKHAWFTVASDWTPKRSDGVPFTLRCGRCTSERRDIVVDGNVVSRRYIYPRDYKWGKGTRPTAREFRKLYLSQLMKDARVIRAEQKAAG